MGVIVENVERSCVIPSSLSVILIGIITRHPITDNTKKIFRHIFAKRMKMMASKPTVSARSASLVFRTGFNQANKPLPIGGGACFSSACLTLGA